MSLKNMNTVNIRRPKNGAIVLSKRAVSTATG